MIYWSNAIDYSDDDDWDDEGNAFYCQGGVCHKDNDNIRYEVPMTQVERFVRVDEQEQMHRAEMGFIDLPLKNQVELDAIDWGLVDPYSFPEKPWCCREMCAKHIAIYTFEYDANGVLEVVRGPQFEKRMSTKAQLQHLKSQAEEMKDAKTLVGRAEYHFRMHRYLAFKQATLRTEPAPPTDAEREAINALVDDVGLDGPINVKALNKAQRIANKVKAGSVDKKEAKYIIEHERYDDVASDAEDDADKDENPSA